MDFPQEVIKEIARVQEILKNKKFTGKLTEIENLHLTLKFLGEIDQQTLEKVKERLSSIKFPKIASFLDYTGTFTKRGNPNIVWIKVGGSDIPNLQKQIDESLKNIFKPEERFMSHLTIARIKYVKDSKDFNTYIKNIKLPKIQFSIDNFKLKQSELNLLGPIYTTLNEYKFIL
ncbi:MAG: RNA 2',3'-cyclic phosphodiesterase [Nanoarchaeota archaeon]|nr:RNA 2',3'-cyclic phosphodiesterase [Nanoarchaeota archaeon]